VLGSFAGQHNKKLWKIFWKIWTPRGCYELGLVALANTYVSWQDNMIEIKTILLKRPFIIIMLQIWFRIGSYELGLVDLPIEICQLADQLNQVQNHLFEHLPILEDPSLLLLCCFKLFNYFCTFLFNFILCYSPWKPTKNET